MPDREKVMEALDCLAHGGGIYDCLKFPCPYGFYGYTDCHKWEIARDALNMLKEQEDLGTDLTNAMELVHKKNERIKKLEEQIETLTKWRMNAGAFD